MGWNHQLVDRATPFLAAKWDHGFYRAMAHDGVMSVMTKKRFRRWSMTYYRGIFLKLWGSFNFTPNYRTKAMKITHRMGQLYIYIYTYILMGSMYVNIQFFHGSYGLYDGQIWFLICFNWVALPPDTLRIQVWKTFPISLFSGDGMCPPSILFDREGFGHLGTV